MQTIQAIAYNQPSFFELEQEILFKKEPLYVGHDKMLPQQGSYIVPHRLNNDYILLRDNGAPSLISNVCKHHQAKMLKDKGEISSIICPFHRWQYDLTGKLKNAPKFEEQPCVALHQTELFTWNQLFFSQSNPDIATTSKKQLIEQIDFSHYAFFETLTLEASYNWKIFIDNYLDDYHVPVIHPGLRSLVNLDILKWEFGDNYSVQMIETFETLKNSSSEKFNRWALEIERMKTDYDLNPVMWALIYPATMIEVYPYMITVSTLATVSSELTINHVDFFFDTRVLALSPNYPALAMASYLETAREDDALCEAIHQGKKTICKRQTEEKEILHPNLVEGIGFFHRYLQGKIPDLFTPEKMEVSR